MNQLQFTKATMSQVRDFYLDIAEKILNISREDSYKYEKEYNFYHENESKILELDSYVKNWYNGLYQGIIDYSTYEKDFYIIESFFIYKYWTYSYLKKMTSKLSFFKDVKKIADLGNGTGLTTLYLSEIFPDSFITGTNLEDTKQIKFFRYISKNHPRINVEINHLNLGKQDLLFASEYFEHFQNPFQHLKELIDTCDPKYLVIANSFNIIGYGHFLEYFDENEKSITPKETNKLFNAFLRKNGYHSEKQYWNDRPKVWVKNEVTTVPFF
jgi:SAM-dependent methyltransferase